MPAEEHLWRLHAHCNKCKTFLRLHYHTNTGTLAIVKTVQLHRHMHRSGKSVYPTYYPLTLIRVIVSIDFN